jgi:hypothetical protein
MKTTICLVIVFLLTNKTWARLGETIEQLTKRYGSADKVYDEQDGLTNVEYSKEGLNFRFQLIELKAESVRITGKINDKEAEVFMARNVPPGTSFQLVENPETPYRNYFDFWKSYVFSDKTSAHFCRPKQYNDGYSELVIETEKMQAFQKWKKEKDEQRKLEDANKKADRSESSSTGTKKEIQNTRDNNYVNAVSTSEDNDAPAPDIFRDRSAVVGGAQMGQDASFASMASALGRYKHKPYLAIGSRWNLKIQQQISQIGVDRVVIQFHVNPDGSLSDIDLKVGNPNSKLGEITLDAVQQTSGLIGPFSSDLLQEKPNGFRWSLAFRIY